jgi:hypothetical protein
VTFLGIAGVLSDGQPEPSLNEVSALGQSVIPSALAAALGEQKGRIYEQF